MRARARHQSPPAWRGRGGYHTWVHTAGGVQSEDKRASTACSFLTCKEREGGRIVCSTFQPLAPADLAWAPLTCKGPHTSGAARSNGGSLLEELSCRQDRPCQVERRKEHVGEEGGPGGAGKPGSACGVYLLRAVCRGRAGPAPRGMWISRAGVRSLNTLMVYEWTAWTPPRGRPKG